MSIQTLARVFFEFKGTVNRTLGPIELTLGGTTFQMRPAPDGYRLAIDTQPWVDPFEGVLTAENAEYVARHGRWRRHPVSIQDSLGHLIGASIIDVLEVESPDGACCGLEIRTTAGMLKVMVEFDDLRVETDREVDDLRRSS